MNPTARRNARHFALQAMYQWQMTQADPKEIEDHFLATQIKKQTDINYFKELIHNVPKKQIEIDELMKPHLKRPLDELDPVELAILRLAIFELKDRLDIPYRVVINEALELTKKFGSIEGFKFVNGVLDQVAKNTRIHEVAADAKKNKS